MLATPEPRRVRQKDPDFRASLGYRAGSRPTRDTGQDSVLEKQSNKCHDFSTQHSVTYMYSGLCMSLCVWESVLSPSTMWEPGTELRSLGLAVSALLAEHC